MIAVIAAGGKQYIVKEGEELRVEWMEHVAPGTTVELPTLLISDVEGKNAKVGMPALASVKATVVEHGRAKKVMVVKYKPKSRYRRHNGHRQPFTLLKIGAIA